MGLTMKPISLVLAVVTLFATALPSSAAEWSRQITLLTATGNRTVTVSTHWSEFFEQGTPFQPLRLGPSGLAALPQGTFNPSGSVVDIVPLGDAYACYAIMLLHGLPGTLSHLSCFFPGTAVGLAPPATSLEICSRPTDLCLAGGAPRARIGWSPPAGEFTSYAVIAVSDGQPQVTPVAKSADRFITTQLFTTATCYVVFVVNGVVPVGRSNVMCALPIL